MNSDTGDLEEVKKRKVKNLIRNEEKDRRKKAKKSRLTKWLENEKESE